MSWEEVTLGQCRLIRGDAREVLPTLGQVDAIITDPPYGRNYIPRRIGLHERGGYVPRSYGEEALIGDTETFDPKPWLAVASQSIFWGANYFATQLPLRASWLVWDKRGGDTRFHGKTSFADCELAWCSDDRPARIHLQIWSGLVRQGSDALQPRIHPTQKPLALMAWCLQRLHRSHHSRSLHGLRHHRRRMHRAWPCLHRDRTVRRAILTSPAVALRTPMPSLDMFVPVPQSPRACSRPSSPRRPAELCPGPAMPTISACAPCCIAAPANQPGRWPPVMPRQAGIPSLGSAPLGATLGQSGGAGGADSHSRGGVPAVRNGAAGEELHDRQSTSSMPDLSLARRGTRARSGDGPTHFQVGNQVSLCVSGKSPPGLSRPSP